MAFIKWGPRSPSSTYYLSHLSMQEMNKYIHRVSLSLPPTGLFPFTDEIIKHRRSFKSPHLPTDIFHQHHATPASLFKPFFVTANTAREDRSRVSKKPRKDSPSSMLACRNVDGEIEVRK